MPRNKPCTLRQVQKPSSNAIGNRFGLGEATDVFEAVNSRIACRHFLDKQVDPDIVRRLVAGAAYASSSSNLQPWNVYAVTGGPLKEITAFSAESESRGQWGDSLTA